jgi:hypothetical protein
MRRQRNQLRTKGDQIRLKTKMTVVETKRPRDLEDIARALDSLGMGIDYNYPAASHHFHVAADKIRQALASIEITGDLL